MLLTFGTAAWNTMSLMGCAEVLSMDRTITSTSGRPGAGSLEKWSMALKPFLSYTVRGQIVPARDNQQSEPKLGFLSHLRENRKGGIRNSKKENANFYFLWQTHRPSGTQPLIYICF